MKNSIMYLLIVVLAISASCQQSGPRKVKLTSDVDSVSYAIGIMVGKQNKMQLSQITGGDKMNIEAMSYAFYSALMGKDSILSDEQASNIIRTFLDKEQKKVGQENLEKGNKFLEENKKKPGISTTESGLQYEIIKTGTGEKPTAESTVKVSYHGTLIDGDVFDSSVERGDTATFGVGQVIPGWTEALQLMPVGSKWKVYLPSSIAYGEQGAGGGKIGPNTALIFEIELHEILKPEGTK
jgi:FKBP-type peptidyl-prolyl cis-trans isomerase